MERKSIADSRALLLPRSVAYSVAEFNILFMSPSEAVIAASSQVRGQGEMSSSITVWAAQTGQVFLGCLYTCARFHYLAQHHHDASVHVAKMICNRWLTHVGAGVDTMDIESAFKAMHGSQPTSCWLARCTVFSLSLSLSLSLKSIDTGDFKTGLE